MEDRDEAEGLIRQKMSGAGVDEAAQRAFLFQYRKLVNDEAGLISESAIEPIASLPGMEAAASSKAAAKTVILKLNGGLGTGMGLERAKSLLLVREGLTFLDIIVEQFLFQRSKVSPQLELYWMNSFSTSADTLAALDRYPQLGPPRRAELLQNKVPKIAVDTLLPVNCPPNPDLEWCPPGHGDLYPSLLGSGLIERLRDRGKEFLFVSNADNLGATLDPGLLEFFSNSGAPFLMEVTRRTEADRKGGHLARFRENQRFVLRELAQCAEEDLEQFQDVSKYRYFNTNSIWLRLDALAAELERSGGLLPLPMIRNQKTVDPRDANSTAVFQLETAMGAAIECFAQAAAIEVPRSRFAPVKTTDDLLGVRSDAYELDSQYRLRLRPERHGVPPIIQLDKTYKRVDELEELVREAVPSLVQCRSLELNGPMRFAAGVELIGDAKFSNRAQEVKIIQASTYRDCDIEL
jgi:UTP--glucose-1-phosphate uridylyltransferase